MTFRYVKDRRPSISPNFNFLGQLVEFDSQLTKQRTDADDRNSLQISVATSDDNDKTSKMPERAPSPSKRPCMIDLSRAVVKQSRDKSSSSMAQCTGAGMTVQSPTIALSRLQFVELRQAPSSAAAAAVKVLPKSATVDTLTVQTTPSFQSTSVVSIVLLRKYINDFFLTVVLEHGRNPSAHVIAIVAT